MLPATVRTMNDRSTNQSTGSKSTASDPTAPVDVVTFMRCLRESRLLSQNNFNRLEARIPQAELRRDARRLADLLVHREILTDYQAAVLCRGESHGLVMGDYVVQSKIGEGGMGVVLKAKHRRMGRLVALKVLSPAINQSENAVRRFKREIQAAARLRHPNIVMAYDASQQAGQHFLVMELVDGPNLQDVLTRCGPLSVEQAVNYIVQAARGLAHAHQEKIIHRDVKPENLLLDGQGVVKVSDLGLARLTESLARGDAVSLTTTGSSMGTPDYMAPEQAADAKSVDQRADIYSLGCTLYCLLAGRPPYVGETVANKVIHHEDKSIPSLLDAREEVPSEIDQAYRKMIRKDPNDRFATIGEVTGALRPFYVADVPSPSKSKQARPHSVNPLA